VKSVSFNVAAQLSSTRAISMLLAGVIVGVFTGVLGSWTYAPAIGWVAASLTYICWVWSTIGRLDAAGTVRHATREDPARFASDVAVLSASIASLGAVALTLLGASAVQGGTKVGLVALALATVVLSWLLVLTLFTLRYADIYYNNNARDIDFNQDNPPRYTDFANLAFTLGTTFRVSGPNLRTHTIRITALRHALLSYILGIVVLAIIITLVIAPLFH
jgi:uncharacterized membrane protein